MAVLDLTFSGITNPSDTHKATYGAQTDNTVASPGTEVATADYTSLSVDDSDYYDYIGSVSTRILFRWLVDIPGGYISISEIAASHGGYKEAPGSGRTLKIWNFSISDWETLGTGTVGSAPGDTASGSVTVDCQNYVSENYIYTAIDCGPDPLHSNFATLTFTYEPYEEAGFTNPGDDTGYKVYSINGAFRRMYTDMVDDPQFTWNINEGLGELTIKLARKFDAFGEGDDVACGNDIQLYVTDYLGNANLVYTGYISSYEPTIDGVNEYVIVHVLGYGTQLSNGFFRNADGTQTSVTLNSYDPSDMAKAAIDNFRSLLSDKISYTAESVDDTGVVISYAFNTQTYRQVVDKIRELSPANWFWRIGADNVFHMHTKSSTPTHHFTLGREIISIRQNKRIEDLYNVVYFKGKDTLYRVYKRQDSIDTYGERAYMMQDERVTSTTTADYMASSFLDEHESVETRIEIQLVARRKLSDNGYEIETILPGDTCLISNLESISGETKWDESTWDVSVWDYDISYILGTILQITSISYSPDKATVTLSSKPLTVANRMEDIYRNLEGYRNAENPTTPTA